MSNLYSGTRPGGTMSDSKALPWATRVSRAESGESLDRLMDAWYEGVKASRGLIAAVGFTDYMDRRDWNGAKRSIERTYGRSNREHEQTLDTLAAAIQCKRMLKY
jgi:hypothetical protein